MNWFTISLLVLGVAAVTAVLVQLVLTWRKPGRQIGQNASMDSEAVNSAHLQNRITRNGGHGGFPGL